MELSVYCITHLCFDTMIPSRGGFYGFDVVFLSSNLCLYQQIQLSIDFIKKEKSTLNKHLIHKMNTEQHQLHQLQQTINWK